MVEWKHLNFEKKKISFWHEIRIIHCFVGKNIFISIHDLKMYNELLTNNNLPNMDFAKTLTRSDEKFCIKNLANTDIFKTLTRSATKKAALISS